MRKQHVDEPASEWDESDETVAVTVKRPLDAVIPVRLPAAQWRQVRDMAGELGVGPSTLVRMWVFEKLSSRTPPAAAASLSFGESPADYTPGSTALDEPAGNF